MLPFFRNTGALKHLEQKKHTIEKQNKTKQNRTVYLFSYYISVFNSNELYLTIVYEEINDHSMPYLIVFILAYKES